MAVSNTFYFNNITASQSTTTIAHADIVALSTTPFTLIPAISGIGILPIRASVQASIANAYTNIASNCAGLNIHTSDWSADFFSYLPNGSAGQNTSVTSNAATQLFGTTGKHIWIPAAFLMPTQNVLSGVANASNTTFVAGFGGVGDPSVWDPTPYWGSSLVIAFDNNGSGNFTGGNSSNFMVVTVQFYQLEDWI